MTSTNFEQYYNQIATKLTNYLVASGSDYGTACDIVQETFLRIWKMGDDVVDDIHQVSGLCYTIARRIRLDGYRKQNRVILQDEIRDEDVGSQQAESGAQIDNDMLRKRIDAALSALPPLLRDAYTLFQISELSIREIAQITNVSESNVKVRIHRAKQKLQEMLKDLLDEM